LVAEAEFSPPLSGTKPLKFSACFVSTFFIARARAVSVSRRLITPTIEDTAMSDASVQQQSGLAEVRELERDLTLNEIAELEGCHSNTIRYRIKDGQYESYLDGGIRKVTRRSALARRNRLLQTKP
jgi:hypothetical protein